MEKLKFQIRGLINICDKDWELFSDELRFVRFGAKEIIVSEGGASRCIYFINEGVMRTYYLDDGKDISTYFACDGQLITAFAGFITQKPSHEFLEAVDPVSAYSLSYKSLKRLYTVSSDFEKLGRMLAEQNYLCVLERTLNMQTKKALDRYRDFIQRYDPKIVKRVPQYQIASYLGIAPESLSRIRKNIK